MTALVTAGRVLFGAFLVANGLNHFFLGLWAEPTGHEPLAIQLMDAFAHSGLMHVAMAIELVTGALILTGVLVPVALCILMPVSTCALFWAVVLEQDVGIGALALLAFAANGVLMLAYLPCYRDALARHALSLGET